MGVSALSTDPDPGEGCSSGAAQSSNSDANVRVNTVVPASKLQEESAGGVNVGHNAS